MTKYRMLLAALFALAACGCDDIKYTEDGWAIYAGLEWSPRSKIMTWYEAMDYCEAMGARLPNINELRKIIINCPGTTDGGACQISDPDCLSHEECGSDDCYCDETASSYSVLGDKRVWLWSSSPCVDHAGYAWCASFFSGSIYYGNMNQSYHFRCVR